MSTIINARDKILQAATVRTEPVTLPPTVVVPPGQIGAGSLPEAVKGAGGNTLVHQGNFQAQTVIANQIDSRGLTIRDEAGTIVFSAGQRLSAARVQGLGDLALQSSIDLATQVSGRLDASTKVTNLGSLAFASTVAANQIVSGSFIGKTFSGGHFSGTSFEGGTFTGTTFNGGTFNGVRLTGDVVNATNIAASGYIEAARLIARTSVDAWDLACNGTFSLNTRPAGAFGKDIVLRGDNLRGSINIDGVDKSFTMTISY
ncbi:pentapeptide repeat-containing protein [Pigmentiphaga aceris]|uniref:Pentapeptide repeat-containing protein n=1 Tax=Pigmentiphaga aceris TaxID=1940612 RepID=A0A5C0B1H6_9BURK|nr:pentapeptide repeat-containing protein [Pigmentiphaga aceris]QEI07826.1 pentapeptide repeat-containing protein [Pigmentiphaga aceris]